MFAEGSPLISHRWLVRVAVAVAAVMVMAGFRAQVRYIDPSMTTREDVEVTLQLAGTMGVLIGGTIAALLVIWRRGYLATWWLPFTALLLAAIAFFLTTGEWTYGYRFGDEMKISIGSYVLAAAALVEAALCVEILRRPMEEVSGSSSDAWRRDRLPGN